ncbi:MAG: NAD(P)-dependent oxidoreductase [Calditrichaeota bacterium]|nr:NAD(P)-dependent oxidoreductase [Calditrichota bacterium]
MKIALLGTGLMGYPMAEQLIATGHDVIVWNRTREKALPLSDIGVQVAVSAKDAIEAAEIIILMFSDGKAISDTLFPVLNAPKFGGKTVLQMGTISPDESKLIYLQVVKSGGEYLEAPVLGSVPQVQERRLIVMVGSTLAQFQQHESIFRIFGSDIYWIGEVGHAATLKLALNHLIAAETAAFSLSLGMVRSAGVDVDMFMSVLRRSALYAPTFDKKLDNYLTRDFDSANFPVQWLLKDVGLVLQEAANMKLDTRAVSAIYEILNDSNKKSAKKDYSALYNIIHPDTK